MTNAQPTELAGSHNPFRWLVTERHDLESLLRCCPQVLGGKYIAVTSLDSGPMFLMDEEKALGWQSRNEIAYSPQITLSKDGGTEGATSSQCAGYDEWYIFDSPFDLGMLCHGNVFESSLTPGNVWTFVNYDAGFALHNPKMAAVSSLFWKQLEWIQPESFIADSAAFLTFVSRNERMFVAVYNALRECGPNS